MEYKFRAWHEESKEMVYFNPDKLCKDSYQQRYLVSLMRGDFGDVLMQYTGLKDKSGIEIYGGDILETPYEVGSSDFMNIDEDEGVYRGKVHYRPSKGFIQIKCLKFSDCEVSSKGVKHTDLENITQSKCKVIGNIYENPGLLEIDNPT